MPEKEANRSEYTNASHHVQGKHAPAKNTQQKHTNKNNQANRAQLTSASKKGAPKSVKGVVVPLPSAAVVASRNTLAP